jgi:uncharacterized delta-60 repeat protein
VSRALILLGSLLAVVLAGCDSGTTVKASAAPPSAVGTTSTVPTGVTATAGDKQVTLNWSPIKGAVRYNAYWSTTNGEGSSGTQLGNVTSPFTHSGLVNGVPYYYVVTEVGTGGEGPPSAQVSATPAPVPLAPTGVTAAPGDSQVTVAWNPVPGATSHNVYWSTNGGGTSGFKITGVVSPFVHTQRSNGAKYYYVVTATNSVGDGPPSLQVSATPSPAPPPPGPTAPPPPPSGSPDLGFNGTGVVTFNITSPFTVTQDQGKALVTDSQNRPVLLSSANISGNQYQAISRWLYSGAPDKSFGTTPNVSVQPGSLGGGNPIGGTSIDIRALAKDGSGKLYVLSSGWNCCFSQYAMFLSRFLPSGLPDTTFGGSGFITIWNSIGGTQAGGYALAVDSQGRIVVGGYMFDAISRQYATVWRFRGDSTPDADFGLDANGISIQTGFGPYGTISALPGTSIGSGSNLSDVVTALVIDNQDRIVIAGNTYNASFVAGIFVARLSAGMVGFPGSGGLDDGTFGDSFYNYTTAFNTLGGNWETSYALVQNGMGRQYVVGYSNDSVPKSWMTVWSFANGFSATAAGFFDGVPDTTFGSGGHSSRTGSAGGTIGDFGYAAALDGMGRIVVAGTSSLSSGQSVMTVWRMQPNGASDPGFATPSSFQPGSVWEPSATGGTSDTASGVAVDGNGNVVVTGSSWTPSFINQRAAIWRLLP